MSLAPAFNASPAPCPPPAAVFDPAAECAPSTLRHARRGELAVTLVLRHADAQHVTLRYELLGGLGLPTVCVAGGISAHRHVAASAQFPEPGWWGAQVGAGRALDPARVAVLAFDWVGADGALDAVIDPADQADALAALLDALDIDTLAAFVGSSYGAMVGLQFAARHGARLRRLVAIRGTHRAHPYASAWRALQRRAVALGALQCDEPNGVALARQLAMLSYRTPAEFDLRFDAPTIVHGRVRVGAEAYLDHCGAAYAARTPAAAFLRLSESIDLQAIEPETIHVPVDVVAVEEDRLVPIDDARELAARSRDARLHVLHSRYGHDAFLKETVAIARIVRDALAQEGLA
jgi:homoserine O-acetyltransferase/O-succinyltransferase